MWYITWHMMREACGESLEPARFWLAPVDTGNQIHFMIMEKVSILQWASISPCVNISQRMLPHAYQQLKAHWLGFAEKNVGTWKAMPGLCMVNSAKICAQHLERISWHGTSSVVLNPGSKTSHAPITSGDERESDSSRLGHRRQIEGKGDGDLF